MDPTGEPITDCKEEIVHLLEDHTDAVFEVLDAFGKVPAGVLNGNLDWIGDYDECMDIVKFKYCSINFGLNGSTIGSPIPLELRYGVCVPEVCSEDDIIGSIDNLTRLIPTEYSYVDLVTPMFAASPVNCQTFPQRPYDAGFICFTIFCLMLAILILSGAFIDVYQKYKKRKRINDSTSRLPSHQSYGSTGATNQEAKKPSPSRGYEVRNADSGVFHEVLLCFAFTRNLSKLLDTSIGQTQSIGCLHGIRVISLAWVALGHTFGFNFMAGIANPTEPFEKLLPSFSFQAVGNAYSAVDTFFFMSGFLLSYMTFTRMSKSNGNISWLQFYFHRIWRITPLYAFVILFMIYYHPYFGDGPKWYQSLYLDSLCEKYWWRNLLYINNYFAQVDLCMQWSWYLSCDMQFFIISPLILLPLFRSQTVGIIIASIMSIASLVVTGVLIGNNELVTNIYGVMLSEISSTNYVELVYIQPYTRIVPYLIGMIVGYFINRQASENRRIRLSSITVSVGWALAFATGVSVVYGTYTSYGDMLLETVWTNAVNVLYGTFSRLGWSLALSWVVFACYYGYGGWINDFLSWSFWIPLSRLTFSAYLVHGLVIQTYYHDYPASSYYSAMSFTYVFCGSLMLSYASAALFSIAIEYPCVGLEKLILRNNDKSKHVKDEEKSRQQNDATTANITN